MSKVWLYIIAHKSEGKAVGPVKVGIAENPRKRLATLQTGNPRELMIYWAFVIPDREPARTIERGFHETHAESRLQGEWFDFDPPEALYCVAKNLEAALSVWLQFSSSDVDKIMESVGAKQFVVIAEQAMACKEMMASDAAGTC